MPTMFILAVAAMGLVLVLLAVIVVVIKQEPSTHELTRQAPRPMPSSPSTCSGCMSGGPIHLSSPISSGGNRAIQRTVPLAHRTYTPGHRSVTSDRAPSGK
jgi:hypothetical protein